MTVLCSICGRDLVSYLELNLAEAFIQYWTDLIICFSSCWPYTYGNKTNYFLNLSALPLMSLIQSGWMYCSFQMQGNYVIWDRMRRYIQNKTDTFCLWTPLTSWPIHHNLKIKLGNWENMETSVHYDHSLKIQISGV